MYVSYPHIIKSMSDSEACGLVSAIKKSDLCFERLDKPAE